MFDLTAPAHIVIAGGRVQSPLQPDLVAPWWSIAKTVLAAAAFALARDGALDLDAPYQGRAYTLRHVLHHTAGLRDYSALTEYHAAVGARDEPWPRDVMLARANADLLLFPPGAGWSHSNIGYAFVSEAIARAFGAPLADAVVALVLRPLGVTDARFVKTPADLAGIPFVRAGYHPGWVYHGMMVGSARAAVTFLSGLASGQLLPEALWREMQTPHSIRGVFPGRPFTPPTAGLGLFLGNAPNGGRVLGHTGSGPGGVSALYHFPDAAPARTIALFAPWEDADAQGRIEREAAALAGFHISTDIEKETR